MKNKKEHTLDSMGTELGGSKARKRAIAFVSIFLLKRWDSMRGMNYLPKEASNGSTGSGNNVDGRKRRHFGDLWKCEEGKRARGNQLKKRRSLRRRES